MRGSLLYEPVVAEVLGGDVLGQGNPGSPGSGGASPYLFGRSLTYREAVEGRARERGRGLGAIWKGEEVASQGEGCDLIFPAHTA